LTSNDKQILHDFKIRRLSFDNYLKEEKTNKYFTCPSCGFPTLTETEAQMIAMERKREKREAFGEIETEHPGYLGAQDTYYVGNIKGVGRIYQQTFIDTYSKVAFAKIYDRKNAITAADMLNDKVMPFFEEQQIPLLRILTDRGTEYCGKAEYHEYELYLRIENVEHSKTKVKSPQSNGICERFHRTIQDASMQLPSGGSFMIR
jgi:transposase InsO family protein